MTNKFLAGGSVALMGAGSFLAAYPAQAFTDADCGAAPDGGFIALISDDVCSMTLNANSDTDWTIPSGVDRVAAVVIGAGGGSVNDGYAGYAGGGGEVLYVESVTATDLDTILIGVGGLASESYLGATDGGNTTLGTTVARGGKEGTDNASYGYSGSEKASYGGGGSLNGGGAKAAATEGAPGAGYLLDDPELTEGDELFAMEGSAEFGRGGSSIEVPDFTGYGEGGSATAGFSSNGTQGAIIFRWALSSSEPLAATGVDANGIGITAGALGLSGVALGVVAAIRRARRAK